MSDQARIQDIIQVEAAAGADVFANAHDWQVGQIQIINTGLDWKSGLAVVLNPVPDASHTRNLKLSPPNSRCFSGTRKEVLEEIRSWIDSTLVLNHPHIMWVYGYAGCGKSAIAQEICSHFSQQGRLAGAFFFFRGAGARSNTSRFATTIAAQVAVAIPATAPLIEAAIKANPGLLSPTTTSLSDQFDKLVYQPIYQVVGLVASFLRGPYIIALDGLDECADHEEVADLVERTVVFFERKPYIPLRIVITSRVENHIHNRLHSSKQVKLLDLVQQTSDADILIALEAGISKERGGLVLACDESWPSSEDKARLVKHIGGSFIFFTTIMKLLFDPYINDGLTPMERLPLILSMQPDFDDLYRAILGPSQALPHFQDIVSTISLAQEPLSIAQIAGLLDIQPPKVASVLINLNAIMQVPGDDRTPVTLWHTSLRDFLCSKDRAGRFFVNDHRTLAYGCAMSIVRSDNRPPTAASEYSRQFFHFHWEQRSSNASTEGDEEEMDTEGGGGGKGAEGDSEEADTFDMLAQFLLKALQDNRPVLEIAIRSKDWKVVLALVDANTDVNVRFSEPYANTVCALNAACHHEEWSMVYLLLRKGADPNVVTNGRSTGLGGFMYGTALAFAAAEGRTKLVNRLLECGADPNLRGGVFGTPLRAACERGTVKIVDTLLDHGADPNLEDRKWGTALHECAARGKYNCARALLTHKANPNIQDVIGRTPLHIASEQRHGKIVDCLLEFKADETIEDNEGRIARQLTKSWE